ncbi:MAG: hypothetical protein LBV17_00115 [Treponema sp.]|jgi:hypothetical protein|nr:hypothetical protein [Treponema sp.]
MSIGAISNNSIPNIGYAITASMSGRTSIPVSQNMLIYSHFKHVSGTPAPEGTKGVNISKLKILDTLIEQLSKMKSQSSAEINNLSESDEKRINALIDQYQKQIKAAQAAPIYTPATPVTGSLFNIAA